MSQNSKDIVPQSPYSQDRSEYSPCRLESLGTWDNFLTFALYMVEAQTLLTALAAPKCPPAPVASITQGPQGRVTSNPRTLYPNPGKIGELPSTQWPAGACRDEAVLTRCFCEQISVAPT